VNDTVSIRQLAIISIHASPLAPMGGSKTGGMNVYVRKLAQEFGRRGIAVDIFTRRTASEAPQFDTSLGDKVRVIHIVAGEPHQLDPDSIFPHLPEFIAGVIAFAEQHGLNYDAIYSHYWLSGWVANRLKAVWGIPFVQMFHTLGQMKNRTGSSTASPDTRIAVETQIVDWADRIIAATPAEYSQLLWLYRANRRKISIVSPGVDLNLFRPLPKSYSKRVLNLPAEADMLLFVGRIEPLKGVDTAIEALRIIRMEQPELLPSIRFIVIGGNPADRTNAEMVRLQEKVEEYELSTVVQFAGAKEQDDLVYYYTAATAVIMPSDYESFGMVALEAMASGTPVIASEVGGLAFLVRDGETGYLVPARDPAALAHRITAILQHPDIVRRMSVLAADLAQQYTWTSIADELLASFRAVLHQSSASPHTH
jgi:D-inositol-3-phosphate glycosyltransferase